MTQDKIMFDGYKIGEMVLVEECHLGFIVENSVIGRKGLPIAKVRIEEYRNEYWIAHTGLRLIPADTEETKNSPPVKRELNLTD